MGTLRTVVVTDPELSQQMPVDPEVLVGTLPNGLRYYVRANGKPAHRAELRLVVKAGSVLEDEDQRQQAGRKSRQRKRLMLFLVVTMILGTAFLPASYGVRIGTDVLLPARQSTPRGCAVNSSLPRSRS